MSSFAKIFEGRFHAIDTICLRLNELPPDQILIQRDERLEVTDTDNKTIYVLSCTTEIGSVKINHEFTYDSEKKRDEAWDTCDRQAAQAWVLRILSMIENAANEPPVG